MYTQLLVHRPQSHLRILRRAAFSGGPATSLAVLPPDGPVPAWLDHPRPRWLAGVCLGALGRYDEARRLLLPDGQPVDSAAASARASHLRQLGRHGEAEALDVLALQTAAGGTRRAGWVAEALTDALIGLAADAVGAGDLAEARRRLTAAAAEVDRCAGLPGRAGWRPAVRLAWVRAEVALLASEPAAAVAAAEPAVARARAARAPRHVAKSLLVRGVAEQAAGRDAAAVATLRQATGRADRLGLLPLAWPARLVLAYTLDRIRPEAASHELAEAVIAICAILVRLPAAEAATLLARPDIRPLVETYLKSRPEPADEVTRTDYILHERVFITGGEGRRDPAWAEEGDRDQRAHL